VGCVNSGRGSEAYVDHDLVFADELGAPIYPSRLTEAFARHRKAAGLVTGTLHITGHTHATLALTSGVPLHVVAARIGDRPETMLKAYAHFCRSPTSRPPSRWRRLSTPPR
jgi:integrase